MALDFKISSHRMAIHWWWYGFGDGRFHQAVFWMMDNGYWSIWIDRCWSVGLSDHHPLELGEPGPLLFPGLASSLDPGLSAVWNRHFSFFTALCSYAFYWHSAFCGDNHVCSRVLHDCVMPYVLCFEDDIYFRQLIFAFTSLHRTLEMQYYVLACCLL